MNGYDVLRVLDDIADTNSRIEKEEIIARNISEPLFKMVLKSATDPFRTYGIAKMPDAKIGLHEKKDLHIGSSFWMTLRSLQSRDLSGNDAIAAVQSIMEISSPESAEVIKRILTKDLRAGISSSTINKVLPGTVPSFACMLAHKYEAERIKTWPQIVEPKLDGVRVLAFVSETGIAFMSRSGKPFTAFDHFGPMLMKVHQDIYGGDFVFDGEMVSGDFNKTSGDVRRKDQEATDAIFHVFELMPMEFFKGDDKVRKEAYLERRRYLKDCMSKIHEKGYENITMTPQYMVNSHDEIMEYYRKVRDRGLEGLIVKDPKGHYYRRRNHAWMKIKGQESADVPIIDAVEGTGKYEGMLGALVVDVDGVSVNVGSGLSDEQRMTFWSAFHADELVGNLIEVEYHEKTPDGSLRHPRFVRFRGDKPQEEAA